MIPRLENIQMCKKCKQAYYAESHEYPCPWCIIEKKLDVIDRAYKALFVAFIYDEPDNYIHTIKKARKILNEQREPKEDEAK